MFRHALEQLARDGYEPDIVVHLRPTGPVRLVQDIDEVVDVLVGRPDVDAVRSVSLVHQTPFKMWRIADDGTMRPIIDLPGLPDSQSRPRQLLPLVYWQNGYVDALRPRAVLEKSSMWGDRVLPFVVDTVPYELDYPEDITAVEEGLRLLEAGLDLPKNIAGEAPRMTDPAVPIGLLVLDVDGVITDGTVLLLESGDEVRPCTSTISMRSGERAGPGSRSRS